MAIVFVETTEGKVKSSSIEAIVFAHEMGEQVTAVVIGQAETDDLKDLGKYGAKKVLHAKDDRLKEMVIAAYTNVLFQAMEKEGADTMVLADSSIGTPIAARVAARLNASISSNVVEVPKGNVVKRSIYTGKAFMEVELTNKKKVIGIRKNAVEIKEAGGTAEVEDFAPTLSDADFSVKIVSAEKATGDVLLPEADIVVSGGRGMKGPENWGMLEELAQTLHAALGCSKPVSDMGWRPHHEHVGQTGVKVSPQLYIAVGISGAIQHLAGVNSSKYIVVINKDPESPFFKAADYGIVGDAFEVVPKLNQAIKALK